MPLPQPMSLKVSLPLYPNISIQFRGGHDSNSSCWIFPLAPESSMLPLAVYKGTRQPFQLGRGRVLQVWILSEVQLLDGVAELFQISQQLIQVPVSHSLLLVLRELLHVDVQAEMQARQLLLHLPHVLQLLEGALLPKGLEFARVEVIEQVQ